MSSEIAALEELKGRCLAISIAYLDTGVRMRPAIEMITKNLGNAVKRPLTNEEVQELTEELCSLREYLKLIAKKYPEVQNEFNPTIKVCDWLLESPNSTTAKA